MAGVPGRSGANVPEPVVWVLVYRKESATHRGERDLVVKLGTGLSTNFKKVKMM